MKIELVEIGKRNATEGAVSLNASRPVASPSKIISRP